ncbi:MAG: glycogen-binding domain-containing protein [Nitrospirae bacterium]|nr:glycogen-binding domain-containing protein [Nitrospirota bacterium]
MQFKGKTGLSPGLSSLVVGFFPVVLFAGILIAGCSVKYAGPERVEDGVRFALEAKDAKKVAIAGSFNQWDPEKDVLSGPDSDGMWQITIPLPEGRYEYLFLIDGAKWVLDPTVPFVDDGLGGKNSVVSIKQ